MDFDGALSKLGTTVVIVLTSLKDEIFNFVFRLEFEATNNVAKYDALLGL